MAAESMCWLARPGTSGCMGVCHLGALLDTLLSCLARHSTSGTKAHTFIWCWDGKFCSSPCTLTHGVTGHHLSCIEWGVGGCGG